MGYEYQLTLNYKQKKSKQNTKLRQHQVQGMPGLESKLKASLGDLVRLCIKSQKYEGWGHGLVSKVLAMQA